MKKCYSCKWASDKCKNPDSKNKDKFLDDINQCKPMLISEEKFVEDPDFGYEY